MQESLRNAPNAEMMRHFIGSREFLVNTRELEERELWSILDARSVLTSGVKAHDSSCTSDFQRSLIGFETIQPTLTRLGTRNITVASLVVVVRLYTVTLSHDDRRG